MNCWNTGNNKESRVFVYQLVSIDQIQKVHGP